MRCLFLILAVIGIVHFSSCGKEPNVPPEETLNNSVIASGYWMAGTWSFEGVSEVLNPENSFIDIRPLAHPSFISLYCCVMMPNEKGFLFKYAVDINVIDLIGEPGDVSFSSADNNIIFMERTSDTTVTHYDPVPATVSGWIKRDDRQNTRLSPVLPPPYDCDINIECEVDGKPLKIHITRMSNEY